MERTGAPRRYEASPTSCGGEALVKAVYGTKVEDNRRCSPMSTTAS